MNSFIAFVIISKLVVISGNVSNEPQCRSRFDYDFKVVKKLAELESELADQKKAVQKLINDRDGSSSVVKEVAFSAYLTSDITSAPKYRTIIFDEVHTNIGNAYSGITGIFACPTSGVYVFYWVVTNRDYSYMDSELVVNGEERSQAFTDAGEHNDYAVASNVVVTELKSGDQIWIRCGTWHNGKVGGERRTSFSGWKLYNR